MTTDPRALAESHRELLKTLRAIDRRAQGKTSSGSNLTTIFAVRKMARDALTKARKLTEST